MDQLNQNDVVSTGITLYEMNGPTSVAPCHGSIELETRTSGFHRAQEPVQHVNLNARSAPSQYHPDRESQMVLKSDVTARSETGMVHGGGIDLLDPPDTSLMLPRSSETNAPTFHTGDNSVAAADWVDVTHAMLSSTNY